MLFVAHACTKFTGDDVSAMCVARSLSPIWKRRSWGRHVSEMLCPSYNNHHPMQALWHPLTVSSLESRQLSDEFLFSSLLVAI